MKQVKGICQISIKINDFDMLETLNQVADEMGKSWDEVINFAVSKFLKDVKMIDELRRMGRGREIDD